MGLFRLEKTFRIIKSKNSQQGQKNAQWLTQVQGICSTKIIKSLWNSCFPTPVLSMWGAPMLADTLLRKQNRAVQLISILRLYQVKLKIQQAQMYLYFGKWPGRLKHIREYIKNIDSLEASVLGTHKASSQSWAKKNCHSIFHPTITHSLKWART